MHGPLAAPGAGSNMQRIVDFILELDKLKAVTRKTRPLGLARYENSAEHSWQIALLALSLRPYADAPIDIDRVIGMLLVHDIGEIDTGDTMVYVEEGQAERKAAERAAVVRIFGLLPAPQAEAWSARRGAPARLVRRRRRRLSPGAQALPSPHAAQRRAEPRRSRQ